MLGVVLILVDKKPDLIALALYQMAITKYLELKGISYQLEEHLNKDYVMEECLCANDFICDAIYGSEYDSETFIKELNDSSIRK